MQYVLCHVDDTVVYVYSIEYTKVVAFCYVCYVLCMSHALCVRCGTRRLTPRVVYATYVLHYHLTSTLKWVVLLYVLRIGYTFYVLWCRDYAPCLIVY